MADSESKRGLYGQLEDAYYSFLDKVQGAGIPVYKVVDAIEARNIPSFPIAVLALLAVLGAAWWGASAILSGGNSSLTVTVADTGGNALAGATVTASLAGTSIDSGTTGQDGTVKLTVPMGKSVDLSASKTGYATNNVSFTASSPAGSDSITLKQSATTTSKTINVKMAGTGMLVNDGTVTLDFACTGDSYKTTQGTVNGQVNLSLPSDCDSLTVTPHGGFTAANNTISLSADNTYDVSVQQNAGAQGSVLVSVKDDSGNPVSGVDVSLYMPTDGNAPGSRYAASQTSSAGTATFQAVPGSYYVFVSDSLGNYAEYDGLKANAVEQVAAGQTTQFSAVLSKSTAGMISLVVKDKATGDTLAGAAVKFFKGQEEVTTITSDSTGHLVFRAGEDVPYNITVDKAGYLIKNAGVSPSPNLQEVDLEQATADNSQSLLVNVVDEFGKPLDGVRLRLKSNADGSQAGGEMTTGLDGKAIFQRVDDGTYYVYAVKPGYGEKTSDTVGVNSRQLNEVTVKIPVGTGKLDVSVVDESGNPVTGADVKAVDDSSVQVLQDATADSQGKAEVQARADKQVFLIVTASGYLPTTTVPVQLQKDVSLSRAVTLYKSVDSFGIRLDGLYSGDQSVSDSQGNGLNPGDKYTARFRVLVPSGMAFDEAGAHLRTGNEQDNSIDKDLIYITGVRAAAATVTGGTTYDPPMGQATDFQHVSSGNAKWVNVVFSKASGGVYEVEADLQVRQEARIGSLLELWYRAWGKSGGYLRSPVDASLGTSEASAQKQGLYANAFKRDFSVGPTSLCGDSFCASYSIEDARSGLTSAVADSYGAQTGDSYRLVFEISGLSKTPFSNSKLTIGDTQSRVSVDSYSITTALGEQRTGQKSGSEASAGVGDIGQDSVVKGEVDFTPKAEGTIPLQVSIVSGTENASQVYSKAIYLNVQPAAQLGVQVLPKTIVPLITNNLLVKVTDGNTGNAVSNAKVNVLVDGQAVAAGETDIDGVFAYALQSPAENSVVSVQVDKEGFAESGQDIRVSGNVLSVEPSSISESLTVGSTDYKTIDALLHDYSQVPLVVESIAPGKEFDGYVEFGFTSPQAGLQVAPDGNAGLSASIKLGPVGASVTQPTTIRGTVNVVLSNPNFPNKWVASVPLQVSIGFGGEVDDASCLGISPGTWSIISGPTETKTLTLEVTNKCQVAGANVALSNLVARLVPGTDAPVGTFKATTSIANGESAELDNTFKRLAQTVPEGADETITVRFKPSSIVSGQAQGKIEFRASHFTSVGEQKLVDKVDFTSSVNDLAQCVQVPLKGDVTIDSCPFGMGYGNYGANGGVFSSYSNSRYGAYDPYTSRYQYGQGIPPYMGTAYAQRNFPGTSYYDYGTNGYLNSYQNAYYPNSYAAQPFLNYPGYGGAYGQGYGGTTGVSVAPTVASQWACNSGSFPVKNTCSAPVNLTFDPQPGITVSSTTLKVDPNQQVSVQVQPTNFFGRYAVGIQANTTQPGAPTVDIPPVFVNVTSEFMKDYKDCISVSPARTIQFNNFINQPVTLAVVNTCYDQGVYLSPNNGTINFSDYLSYNPGDPYAGNSGLFTYPPTWLGSGNSFQNGVNPSYPTVPNPPSPPLVAGQGAPVSAAQPCGTGGAGLQGRQMIQSWAQIDESVVPSPNGRVTQTEKFELVKALGTYRNCAPPADFFGAEPFSDIGNLRYFLTSGYYTVNGRTNLLVNFTDPYGETRVTYFPMIIQDLWPLAEYAQRISEKFTSYGNPTVPPLKCLNMDALNFSKFGALPVDKAGGYSTSENGNLFIINDKTGCGSVDHLNDQLNPSVFRDPKTNLIMKVAHDGHEARISFDTSNWNGQETDFTNMQGVTTLTRVSPPVTQLVSLTISFRAAAKAGQGAGQKGNATQGQQQAFLCSGVQGAETGTAAFTKYGFQHFKLDWRPPAQDKSVGIGKNACDAYANDGTTTRSLNPATTSDAPLFCDGTQAMLSFLQKAGEIRSIVSKISNGTGTCSSASYSCQDAGNQNSLQLYRYVLSQDRQTGYFVVDSAKGHTNDTIVDLSNADTINNPAFAPIKSDLKTLPSSLSDTSSEPVSNTASRAITSLLSATTDRTNDLYGAEVALELRGWNATPATPTPDTLIPSTAAMNSSSGWYVVPLQAYSDFRTSVLAKCVNAVPAPQQCNIAQPGEAPKIVTTAFLNALASGNWKLTARNRGVEYSALVKRLLMTNGKVDSAFSGVVPGNSKQYRNLYEFYMQNATPRMYLTQQDYKQDFVSAFLANSDYKALAASNGIDGIPVAVSADSGTEASAGDYNAAVSYSWGSKNPGISITLSKSRDIAKIDSDNAASGFQSAYSKNLLFNLPLDGPVGTAPSAQNREFMYFNSYNGLSDPNANPTAANTGGLRGYTYQNSYPNTQGGTILSLDSSGSLVYSPSDPISLKADMRKQQGSEAGILFTFRSSDGTSQAVQPIGITLHNDAGTSLSTGSYDGTRICPSDNPNKNAKYDGMVLGASDAGGVYRGVAFVPARASSATQTTPSSSITLACLRDSGTQLSAWYKLDPAAGTTTLSSQNSAVDLSSKTKERYSTTYTLRNLLDMVKDGGTPNPNAVCVKASDNGTSLGLYWNQDYFTK